MTHQTDLCVASGSVTTTTRCAVGRLETVESRAARRLAERGVTGVVVGLFVAHGSRSWADVCAPYTQHDDGRHFEEYFRVGK